MSSESDINTIKQVKNQNALDTFYITPYPVTYAILEAYCMFIHEHSITLKEQLEWNNNKVKHLMEVMQYIIQEHEIVW